MPLPTRIQYAHAFYPGGAESADVERADPPRASMYSSSAPEPTLPHRGLVTLLRRISQPRMRRTRCRRAATANPKWFHRRTWARSGVFN